MAKTPKRNIAISAESRAKQLAGLKPFKPGQSGNPSGRPKKTPITSIYEKIFDDPANLEKIEKSILATILAGRMGSVLTLKEAAERLEGKVKQGMEHSGEIALTLADRMKKAAERV